MARRWGRALVGIGVLVLNAHAAPMPLPDEVPAPEWFKVSMSRDGLGLWLYVLPSRSSTKLPRDDRAHVYVRGDPKHPSRGDRGDPQLFVRCRAPYPPGSKWADTEETRKMDFSPTTRLHVQLHPDAPDEAGPFSSPIEWIWGGLTGKETERIEVTVDLNGDRLEPSHLERRLSLGTYRRQDQWVRLDAKRILPKMKEAARKGEEMIINVEGPGIRIEAAYPTAGAAALVDAVVWHCLTRNRKGKGVGST